MSERDTSILSPFTPGCYHRWVLHVLWLNLVSRYLPEYVICILFQHGQSLKAPIQLSNKRLCSFGKHDAEIHASNWHLDIDQIQPRYAAGLITWIALIYANRHMC